MFSKDDGRMYLKPGEDEHLARRNRRSTHTGQSAPWDEALGKLEHGLGQRLRPVPVGRPNRLDARTDQKRSTKQATVPACSADVNLAPVAGGTNIQAIIKLVIPEPASLSLLALGALALVRRR